MPTWTGLWLTHVSKDADEGRCQTVRQLRITTRKRHRVCLGKHLGNPNADRIVIITLWIPAGEMVLYPSRQIVVLGVGQRPTPAHLRLVAA